MRASSKAFVAANCDRVHRLDYAVEGRRLDRLGIDETDLRSLIVNGIIAHSIEKPSRAKRRNVRPAAQLCFVPGSCFALTETGASLLQQTQKSVTLKGNGQSVVRPKPKWDRLTRCLYWFGAVITQYRRIARNQELVVTAFEEQDWPMRIDDPLPGGRHIDQPKRLADTVYGINKHMSLPWYPSGE